MFIKCGPDCGENCVSHAGFFQALHLKTKIVAVLLIATLSACGGGNSGSSNPGSIDLVAQPAGHPLTTETSDLIEDLNVEFTTMSSSEYQYDLMQSGKTPYLDRDYTFSDVPAKFENLCYIRSANDDRYESNNKFMVLKANKEVTVYVGFDVRISQPPAWVGSWAATGDKIGMEAFYPQEFAMYQKSFDAGSIVLGGNEAGLNNYIVLVQDPNENSISACTQQSRSVLTFSWEPNMDYVSGYRVYFGNNPGNVDQRISEILLTDLDFDPARPSSEYHSWDNLGLFEGETGCFSVTAFDDLGESEQSSPVCIGV